MSDPRGKEIGYYCDRCHFLNPMPSKTTNRKKNGKQKEPKLALLAIAVIVIVLVGIWFVYHK